MNWTKEKPIKPGYCWAIPNKFNNNLANETGKTIIRITQITLNHAQCHTIAIRNRCALDCFDLFSNMIEEPKGPK